MVWGRPVIAQCDNGGEFQGALLILIRTLGVCVINGIPHKPTTKGLVEQGKNTVKQRLKKWMSDTGTEKMQSNALFIRVNHSKMIRGESQRIVAEQCKINR